MSDLPECHVDVESRSAADLRKLGVAAYASDPTTDLWCATFWFDGEVEPIFWELYDPFPQRVADHIAAGGTMVAFNAAFELNMWKYLMGPRYGWPTPGIEQWRCVMAQCLAMALPASLQSAAQALKSPIEKDEQGARLMLQMAKPRDKIAITWWDTPDRLERLYAYNIKDVAAEIEVDKRTLRLSPSEQKLWWLDQKINLRGIYADRELCRKAITIVDDAKAKLDRQMAKVTDHDVTGCANRNQFVSWLRKFVPDAESVNKEALAELLARDDLPEQARQAIELRREGAKAATSKIDALLNGTGPDSRARGLLQYHGTATGRWGGRRFQPQNLLKGQFEDIDTLVSSIATGNADFVEMMYGNTLTAVGSAVRSMIIAAPGHKLVTADFSNIEGRVAAWYAGEDWKCDAFRAYDAGTGPDLYKVAYSRAFGIDIKQVTKLLRQIGKVMELSLQYQGGHGAFVAMAANYGVKPDDLVAIVKMATDPELWEKTLSRFRPQNGFGMKPETWTAIRILIDGWRTGHPYIKQSWADLEDAAKSALEFPGDVFSVGAVKFKKSGSFLFMRLPSGRAICFPYPKIKDKKMPWTEEVKGVEKEVYKPSLCYMGVDSFNNQWSEQFAYGGQLFNYVVQGTARDIMAEAMFRVERAGYPIVLTVHDEIVAEPELGHGGIEDFKKIMSEVPAWATGCPISCDGWEGGRYRK